MSLDNTISTPLFQQLAETLRAAIDAGEYPPGSRLPTENELCERYSVSRVTVRKALDEADLKEISGAQPRQGHVCYGKEDPAKAGWRAELHQYVLYDGIPARRKDDQDHTGQPTEEERGQLGLKKDEQTLVVERLRLADGRPMMLETSKFPESFFFLFNADLTNTSLYETIRKETGIVFTRSDKVLEIVFANHQEAKYLGVVKGYPLLSIKSVVHDQSGEHCYLGRQLCIADKFKLMV